jgi:hypothetical protein
MAPHFGSERPVKSRARVNAPSRSEVGLFRDVVRRWPTILVAGYAVAAFSWSMPVSLFPLKPAIDRITTGPLLLFGLWQAWDMFSPDPRAEDICVEVGFTDRDGTTDRRMLTDMLAMGYFDRWQKDRWRKYFNDYLRMDAEHALWRPFAEYAVRRLRAEGYDPASIELVRWWRPCEPVVSPDLRADVRRTSWQSYVFHRWIVPRESGR